MHDAPLLLADQAGSLSGRFSGWDWAVLVVYLLVVSVLGVMLAGRQKDMDDFFRGGNKLPWYAVSGSMIATIISAVTFIAVPSVAYRADGNFTYLQLGLIAGLLARLVVAFVMVPAYYKHKVYSPYDYMGQRLGESARSVTTALFSLMGLLAQASRVYLTAIILELVLLDELAWLEALTGIGTLVWAVGLVGVIAIAWTMLGGIATVIWTDVMLFLVFVCGGLIALFVIGSQMPGGLGQVFAEGWDASKFKVFSLSAGSDNAELSVAARILTEPYTAFAAFIAVTFGNIGSYGTDQLTAQRIFCCKNQNHAKAAVLSSYAAELIAGLMLLVGVGLWAFYNQHPELLTGDAAAAVAESNDNIFPVFILTQVPVGLKGLIVAGIFAAAISSMTSILAALSQTSISAVYLPLTGIDPDAPGSEAQNKKLVMLSRGLIVFWGVALCFMAFAIDAYVESMKADGKDVPLLDLALGLASYVIGALTAAFLLAWLPLKKNAYGLIWSAPMAVFMVVGARFHAPWAIQLNAIVAGVMLATWVAAALIFAKPERRGVLLAKTGVLLVGALLLVVCAKWFWFFGGHVVDADGNITEEVVKLSIAWPWYAVIGGLTAFIFGYLLGEPNPHQGKDTGHGQEVLTA
ncbi:hypothetical protein OT109_09570 [Phycisphaeraceae bacterium D3-23]